MIDNKTVMNAQRRYYLNNRDRLLKYQREYQRNYARKYNIILREKLFDILGGTKCVKCGFNDIRALQFDHINGGGNKDREIYSSLTNLYIFYIKNPDTARLNLQVLCANCNIIKLHENKECIRNI